MTTPPQTPQPPIPLVSPPTNTQSPLRINCPLIADATQSHAPASLILIPKDNAWQIHAVGHPTKIDTLPLPSNIKTINLPNHIIIPALINAHTHLDLTHIGPQPHDPSAGFVPWVDMIRANRHTDPEKIAHSVNLGIQKSLAGGTIAVGDIAGAPNGQLTDTPTRTLAQSPLIATSYLEYFGIGKSAQSAIDNLNTYLKHTLPQLKATLKNTNTTPGLSPHATNTIAIEVYQHAIDAAKKHNLPLTTHLAETLEERQFIATAQGPQRELLERFKVWDNSILNHIGKNNHPVKHLRPILNQRQILAAHVNDASGPNGDEAIQILADTNTQVVYCPRAHIYFGHDQKIGPHRYQDMLAAGINVSLGTDSIVNLNTPDRITPLDDMRLLSTRDNTTMQTLLQMTTTNPARALNLNPSSFTLTPTTTPAGLILLDTTKTRATGVPPVSSASPGLPGEVPEGRRGSSINPQSPWQSAMQSTSPPTWLLFQPDGFAPKWS